MTQSIRKWLGKDKKSRNEKDAMKKFEMKNFAEYSSQC